MMSYLWILLLGSLLAAHAKAQDDVTPGAEAYPMPTSNVSAVIIEERGVEDTVSAAEEESLLSEPTAGSEVEADQPVDPADVSTEPEATDAPEVVEGQSMTPAIGKTEPVTPAADVEASAPATTQAAGSEDNVVELLQTTVSAEEETTVNAGATPAQEESGLDTTPTIGGKVAGNEEAPTDAAANEESSTDEITTVLEDLVRTNPGFNLRNEMETSLPDPNSDAFDLGDALKDENENLPPSKGRSQALNLGDALNEANQNPSASGEPSLGASGSGGHQPQKGNSGSLAGILSAIVVAAVGAVAGYFTYQQKKLCFKNRQEADPEAPHKADAAEAQSDPQVLSTLLNSS